MTTPPVLGFGTAPILGRIDRRLSLAALEQAYNAGIRHFDTARSYGWGEAETLLGGFLQRYPRDSYTLVSKCGIFPVRHSRLLSIAKGAARLVYDRIPAARDLLKRTASSSGFQPQQTYDLATLSVSLDASLRELRTDYLDVLLLHSFAPEKGGLDDVVSWFLKLREQGRIRRYGFSIEGDLRVGLDYLHIQRVLGGAVIQAPVSSAMLKLSGNWSNIPMFAHSPFRFLKEHAPEPNSYASLTALVAVLRNVCHLEAVVCSMFSSKHIDQNVRAIAASNNISNAELSRLRSALGLTD